MPLCTPNPVATGGYVRSVGLHLEMGSPINSIARGGVARFYLRASYLEILEEELISAVQKSTY